jgi:hypothetical protein
MATSARPRHRRLCPAATDYTKTSYQVGYAQHLRDALPNATFVAFTGTPVSSADRDTRAVFGDYIHVYDMQQAKEDGATVAIYYESRLAKLKLKEEDLPLIDDEVDELAEDEEESTQAKLKSRWAALEKVVGAEPRVASVAADLVAHFRRAQQGARRQGHGRDHEPRHLRAPVQRHRQAAPRLAQRRPRAGRHQDHHDRQRQRQGPAAPAHLQQPGQEAAGEALQRPGRPAAPGHRARHVADRL